MKILNNIKAMFKKKDIDNMTLSEIKNRRDEAVAEIKKSLQEVALKYPEILRINFRSGNCTSFVSVRTDELDSLLIDVKLDLGLEHL